MKREKPRGLQPAKGNLPPIKLRIGVLPTRVERDRTIYTRKAKYKDRDSDRRAMGVLVSTQGRAIGTTGEAIIGAVTVGNPVTGAAIGGVVGVVIIPQLGHDAARQVEAA